MSDSSPGTGDQAPLTRFARPAKWAGGILLTIAVLGFGVVPPVARHYAQQIASDLLGRSVTVDTVSFNPFTLAAELRGVRVMEADDSAPALSFARLKVNLELESVVRGGPVLHELALDGLVLNLVRLPQGQHNWSDVVERIAALPGNDSEGDALFSIGNIRVSGGRVDIDDRVEGLKHEVTGLEIGVPFVSNLPVKVDVFVEPALSAAVNGQAFGLSGRTKPFGEERETVLEFAVKDFDLAPWMAYLPFEPAFQLTSGRLGAELELSFSQPADAAPRVGLRGQAQIEQLVMLDKAGQAAVALGEFGVELVDVQPLAGKYHFTRLRLMQPEIDVVRLADGGLNLLQMLPQTKQDAAVAKAKGKPPVKAQAKASPQPATPAPARAPIDFLLASARIRDGVIRLEDRAVPGPFRASINEINLDLRDLTNTGDMPAEIRLDYVTDGGERLSHQDALRLEPFELAGNLSLEQVQPGRYAPYLASMLPGGEIRGGVLNGQLRYRLTLAEAGPDVEIDLESLNLTDFTLGLKGARSNAIQVPKLVIADARLVLSERSVKVGEVGISGASVSAVRLRNGQLDLVSLMGPQSARSTPAKAAQTGQEADWSVVVDTLAIDGTSVRLEDRTAGKPVVLAVDGIALKVDNFSTTKGEALKLELDSRINRRGKLGAAGTVVLDPLKVSMQLDASDIDLLPLQPYVLEQTKIAISRGSLSSKGALELQLARDGSPVGAFKGDLGVANFASVDRLNATDFVRWRALSISGIDLQLPFALGVRDVALTDFYTRLILSEDGALNLREIRPADPAQAEAERAAEALTDGAQLSESPPVRIGRIVLKGGNVAFSDRFVRPNYDANLTGLAGELSGLSSDPGSIAKLKLDGKVDNAAAVRIEGELNPFRQDQYLNIDASVKDFELTGLSSYSGKYVGYGIQKGKLSADLNYRIEERKLEAKNRIFLDQLTFGDAVDSPDALKLPVQLAVSLLKNGRGEIDINLPVSGTMDDPEFSVFGLVVRALFNLVGKAITSPFSLLASGVGGGEELSQLEFDPGLAHLGEAQVDKLSMLAQALVDRPALRLDVTGIADPALDTEGVRRNKLLDQLRTAKLKATLKRGEEAPSLEAVEVSEAEYPVLLASVYDDADIKKPRNLIGLAKRLPAAEMEALLLADIKVSEADLKALALRRAQLVRDWLVQEGQVAADRVFLVSPNSEQLADGGHRVHFSLR
ncbi:DUF748 domain-containing protein [Parazoarcus communis]|uniref:DUF748 domain-containing protein n=1 Tax=Parazoarcus communis SWub3 = DSM 12120 TaxID=1121029 RepID=A0A323UXB5_9RHOO|nr:DUF748 domain-containing protein [Parazoarcus communis]NMG71859.1 DUF748 domain-containing protein [Parazoarcus communis SWub3 = DSM 12120]PZA16280.1 hypothetical protein DNK49_11425 [Azoarcus communis] [Parazoarcus communis SWub3 = DSM 12120]